MSNLKKAVCILVPLLLGQACHASIIPIGSSFTFIGTNTPGNFTEVATFGSTVVADNGAVTISESQVPTGSNGEWDIFTIATTNGGPLAGNINANWSIELDFVTTEPSYFESNAFQWLVNGAPVGPLSNFGSIGGATSSNPILPGWAYYGTNFNYPLAAGTQNNFNEIFVDPYSFVSAGGVNPSTANAFTFALQFTPQQAATPEPASAMLLGTGLVALGLARRRSRR